VTTTAPSLPTRVLVCDDDYLVREGARAVLEQGGQVTVLGTAGDPESLRALWSTHRPDVVLLDIRMPPTFTTEGIDLAHELRAQDPDLGIVVLSQHDDPEYALELLSVGSEGLAYLLKERLGDADRLLGAIAEVREGGSVLDPTIVDALMEAQHRRAVSRLAGLTPRELDVLALMATGKGNGGIARDLAISERSVEKHINAIFKKLGLREDLEVNRRVAAVLFFLQRSSD
jgi:DNA-binding NarL/FixJ family response regulator